MILEIALKTPRRIVAKIRTEMLLAHGHSAMLVTLQAELVLSEGSDLLLQSGGTGFNWSTTPGAMYYQLHGDGPRTHVNGSVRTRKATKFECKALSIDTWQRRHPEIGGVDQPTRAVPSAVEESRRSWSRGHATGSIGDRRDRKTRRVIRRGRDDARMEARSMEDWFAGGFSADFQFDEPIYIPKEEK